MSQPFIGEIKMFAGNYAPKGWALCDGQIMPIAENETLYALLGTTYGGDGNVMFALPDMRGRIPVGDGAGPGLTYRYQGSFFGRETEALAIQNMIPHGHKLQASQDQAVSNEPGSKVLANTGTNKLYEPFDPEVTPTFLRSLQTSCIGETGGDQPHSNLMPALCVSFIIALHGDFPSRS